MSDEIDDLLRAGIRGNAWASAALGMTGPVTFVFRPAANGSFEVGDAESPSYIRQRRDARGGLTMLHRVVAARSRSIPHNEDAQVLRMRLQRAARAVWKHDETLAKALADGITVTVAAASFCQADDRPPLRILTD